MKTKKHFIALLMLALFALMACSGKKTNADENPNALIADGEDADIETASMSEREKTDALIEVAENNDITEIQRLIAAGADVNATDNSGMTALMFAAKEDTAKVLLEAGADVNAKDNDGKTALMFAATNNSSDVAWLLLAAGADANAKDNDGSTALMFATEQEAIDIAELHRAAVAQ